MQRDAVCRIGSAAGTSDGRVFGNALVRLVLVALAFLLLPTAADAERRIALVIGNSSYRNTAALTNPVNDAQDMAAALRNVGFTVLLERDLDKRGMEDAVASFARLAQDADVAVFFYAGHGMQYRGSNYLVPVDAKLEDEFKLTFELAHLDDVLFGLERARGVKILILDACRDNPLADRLTQVAKTRDFASTHGLARIEASRGMVIAYSTQANQVAIDGQGRNSPFTAALVQEIAKPGVEIGTLFRRVAADVNTTTGGRQLPELSLALIGDFYLNNHDTDVQAWAKLRGSTDIRRLRDFVTLYPQSPLVPDVEDRLSSLERAEQARIEAEQRTQARERAERDRLAKEQAERERLAKVQAERDRLAKEQAERDRLAKEQAERDRLAKEQAERERLAREQAALEARPKPGEPKQPPSQSPTPSNPPATPQVAAVPPAARPGPGSARTQIDAGLVREIKQELKRVGCYTGAIDDQWGTPAAAEALKRFGRHASLQSPGTDPSTELLEALRHRSGRVCPIECKGNEVEKNGRCVAKPRAEPKKHAAEAPQTAPRSRPASRGAPCFQFQGRQFCE